MFSKVVVIQRSITNGKVYNNNFEIYELLFLKIKRQHQNMVHFDVVVVFF